jgi:hypothetical protein
MICRDPKSQRMFPVDSKLFADPRLTYEELGFLLCLMASSYKNSSLDFNNRNYPMTEDQWDKCMNNLIDYGFIEEVEADNGSILVIKDIY